MNKIFNQDEVIKIIKMYQDKISVENIAKEFSCEEHDIRTVLKEYQIDRQYNTFAEELTKRVIELHQNRYLHKEIAYICLVSNNGINKILDRNNIPRMSYSERNRKYKRNSDYFQNIDSPEKAYILGLIYADGNVYTPHNAFSICLQAEDSDLLLQIKNELLYEGPLRFYDRKQPQHKDQCWLSIEDEKICKDLHNLGVLDNKSLILKFPTYNMVPKKYINSFVRGYYDGDGSINYSKKFNKTRVSICGTLEFCTALSNILLDMNIRNNISHPKQCGNSNTYLVATSANRSSLAFLQWMYQDSTIKLERKYQYYLNALDQINNKVA